MTHTPNKHGVFSNPDTKQVDLPGRGQYYVKLYAAEETPGRWQWARSISIHWAASSALPSVNFNRPPTTSKQEAWLRAAESAAAWLEKQERATPGQRRRARRLVAELQQPTLFQMEESQ